MTNSRQKSRGENKRNKVLSKQESQMEPSKLNVIDLNVDIENAGDRSMEQSQDSMIQKSASPNKKMNFYDE